MSRTVNSEALKVLDEEIQGRCDAIMEKRPDWPCRRGCDHCCRHLAELPRLREVERRRVENAVAQLNEETQQEIEKRWEEAIRQDGGPVVCPLLDLDAGACRIYEARPIACRTYGFYVGRDGGRYCETIEEMEGEIARDEIIMGNHDAIERRLEHEFGPAVEETNSTD